MEFSKNIETKKNLLLLRGKQSSHKGSIQKPDICVMRIPERREKRWENNQRNNRRKAQSNGKKKIHQIKSVH